MATSVHVAWRVVCYQCQKSFSLQTLGSVANAVKWLCAAMSDLGYPGQIVIRFAPDAASADKALALDIPGTSLFLAFIPSEGEA